VPGQKIPGSNTGGPARTNACPARVPGQTGTFGMLQFGFNILVWQGHIIYFCLDESTRPLPQPQPGWVYLGSSLKGQKKWPACSVNPSARISHNQPQSGLSHSDEGLMDIIHAFILSCAFVE
jgi:hypothetical protein